MKGIFFLTQNKRIWAHENHNFLFYMTLMIIGNKYYLSTMILWTHYLYRKARLTFYFLSETGIFLSFIVTNIIIYFIKIRPY